MFCPFKSSINYCKEDCVLFDKEKCLIAEYLKHQINPFRNLISYDLDNTFNQKEPNDE